MYYIYIYILIDPVYKVTFQGQMHLQTVKVSCVSWLNTIMMPLKTFYKR